MEASRKNDFEIDLGRATTEFGAALRKSALKDVSATHQAFLVIHNASEAIRDVVREVLQAQLDKVEGLRITSRAELRNFSSELRNLCQALDLRLACPCCSQPTLPAALGTEAHPRFAFDHTATEKRRCDPSGNRSQFGKSFGVMPKIVLVKHLGNPRQIQSTAFRGSKDTEQSSPTDRLGGRRLT